MLGSDEGVDLVVVESVVIYLLMILLLVGFGMIVMMIVFGYGVVLIG